MPLNIRHIWAISLICFATVQAQVPIVFIEGNIGAGKSTFVKILQEKLPVVISLEPCDEWQNVDGHNLLQAFYQDPKTWATTFQTYVSMTRIRRLFTQMIPGQPCHMMERSWYSDRYCFGLLSCRSGMINELQWQVYEQMWQWLITDMPLPAAFIYLRSSPELCYQRLKKRNRIEESSVPLEYLQQLHAAHDALLIAKTVCFEIAKVPVLVLDGSLNFKDDETVQADFIEVILDFLKNCGNIDLTSSNNVTSENTSK